MLVVVIKAILGLLFIPIAITLYLQTAEKLKATVTLKTHQRWLTRNWAVLPILILMGLATMMEAWAYRESSPARAGVSALGLFTLSTYEAELDGLGQKPPDWLYRKQELVRKFEFAEYAQQKSDYDKAIESLLELESGRDAQGPLTPVSSYAVSNNLACAYFMKQRNRTFAASKYLSIARERAMARGTDVQKIEANLTKLDELVNRLD